MNTVQDVAVGIQFGQFGREDGVLTMVTQNGCLVVKILKRTVMFEEKDPVPGKVFITLKFICDYILGNQLHAILYGGKIWQGKTLVNLAVCYEFIEVFTCQLIVVYENR